MTTYTQKEWKKLETHSEATENHGKIKIDKNRGLVEWVHGGKRVEARIIRK